MDSILKIINNIVTKGLEHFGKYYSSYRGFVMSNEDPEGYGRLQLKVPQILGNQTIEYWAWQKGTFSGKDYGFQVIPQKGDMVFVEFEYGDPRKPIWTYGHFSKTNKQKEKPEELKNPNSYWFKTPKGHLVKIDDDKKLISIETKKGLTFELDDEKGVIRLNGDKNDGLVKIGPLVNRLNAIENKINSHLILYNAHTHVDFLTVSTGPPIILDPKPIAPITTKTILENTKVKH